MDSGRLAGECVDGGSVGLLQVGYGGGGAGHVLHGGTMAGGTGWCCGQWALLVRCAAVRNVNPGREELDVGYDMVLLDWSQREDWSAWQWRCFGHWVWFCMEAKWLVGLVIDVGGGSCRSM